MYHCPVPIVLVLSLLAAIGCSGPSESPRPDSTLSQTTLNTALEAWQKGEAPKSLMDRQPPILVIDGQWASGATLTKYEIDPAGSPVANTWQFNVKLTIQTPKGKPQVVKTFYNVSAGKTLSVARADE